MILADSGESCFRLSGCSAEKLLHFRDSPLLISDFVSAVCDQRSAFLIDHHAADLREHIVIEHENGIVKRCVLIIGIRLVNAGNLIGIEVRAGVDIAVQAVRLDEILCCVELSEHHL